MDELSLFVFIVNIAFLFYFDYISKVGGGQYLFQLFPLLQRVKYQREFISLEELAWDWLLLWPVLWRGEQGVQTYLHRVFNHRRDDTSKQG